MSQIAQVFKQMAAVERLAQMMRVTDQKILFDASIRTSLDISWLITHKQALLQIEVELFLRP